MPNIAWKAIVSALIAAATSACSPISYTSQSVGATYDPVEDVLTLELIYFEVEHGSSFVLKFRDSSSSPLGIELQPQDDPSSDIEIGAEFVGRMAQGDRVFQIATPLFDFDLDEGLGEPEWKELDSVLSLKVNDLLFRASKFKAGVSMEQARIYLDDLERLEIYQRLRIPNFTEGMSLLNETLRLAFQAGERSGGLTPESIYLDQVTFDLLRADVKGANDWATWTSAGLRLSIPVSPELLAKTLKDGLRSLAHLPETSGAEQVSLESAQSHGAGLIAALGELVELLEPLSQLTVQDDHLILLFAPAENGELRFHFPIRVPEPGSDSRPHRPALRDRLRADGMDLPNNWTRED